MNIKVKILDNNAKLPIYSTPGSACMDVICTSIEYRKDIDTYIFHTGLAFEIPENHAMLIFPRSSNRKTDYYMPNSVGILDSDYRGELMIVFKERNGYFVENASRVFNELLQTINDNIVVNLEDEMIDYYHKMDTHNFNSKIITEDNNIKPTPYQIGDKIAQIMIIPYPKVKFEVVNKLSASERGEGGFGSTGR